MTINHVQAHGYTFCHRKEVSGSARCGCFYCRTEFPTTMIRGWVDDGQTALCPICGMDSVVPGCVMEGEMMLALLHRMNRHWNDVGMQMAVALQTVLKLESDAKGYVGNMKFGMIKSMKPKEGK